ncbi:MAG: ImmA/IrrE family metallo-endopeptidase [Clostridiaceae bacterium]|nr:ImmA/IrrE family metallo-endopeptidase [Clostridiaceae bacterium]
MDAQVIQKANQIIRRYKTRNPYDIIDQRDIGFDYTYRYPNLLGYYCVHVAQRFIRINGNAGQQDKDEAAAHELAHDVFDYSDACNGMTFQDTFFFSRSNSLRERRANLMSAELLIEDDDVLDPMGYYRYIEFYEEIQKRYPNAPQITLDHYAAMEFGEQYGGDFLTMEQLAQNLGRNQDLVDYKMKALLVKGYELPVTPELKSDYLKR